MSDATHTSDTHEAKILDHNYDGIQEYDNPTPGWWHLIFLASVFFCFPYILVVHFNPDVLTFPQRIARVEAEVAAKQFLKVGKLELNEETLLSAMGHPDWLTIGQGIFRANCISCHGDKGQGLVGPNMTDDSYKNIKTLMDIPRVVQEGAAAQAMPSWRNRLNQNEIILVSAYVASLRGQNLSGPRPTEGEKIPPWPAIKHEPPKPADGAGDGKKVSQASR